MAGRHGCISELRLPPTVAEVSEKPPITFSTYQGLCLVCRRDDAHCRQEIVGVLVVCRRDLADSLYSSHKAYNRVREGICGSTPPISAHVDPFCQVTSSWKDSWASTLKSALLASLALVYGSLSSHYLRKQADSFTCLQAIGLRVARIMAHGFGSKVVAYDPQINPELEKDDKVTYMSLDELLSKADIITLHSPLLPATKHMINTETIGKMKDGAILINTSRGGLVDTKALIDGLKSKKIAAVGLDVYEKEGAYFFEDRSSSVMQDDLLGRLLSFNNVFVSGHQAFLTKARPDSGPCILQSDLQP